jgi:hypothetical protein
MRVPCATLNAALTPERHDRVGPPPGPQIRTMYNRPRQTSPLAPAFPSPDGTLQGDAIDTPVASANTHDLTWKPHADAIAS